MTDLRNLLDVPSDEVKKPPVLPVGTYHGFIEKYEPGESTQKKTKFLRVSIKCTRADESTVSSNSDFFGAADAPDLTKKNFRKDYYLLEDKSQHWRLKDMLEKVGISCEGRTLLAAVPELTGKPVKFDLTLRSNSDNTAVFNEVADGTICAED